MIRAAQFRFAVVSPHYVVIEDIGHEQGCLTVTNDAEGVLRRLYASGHLCHGRNFFYFDSAGECTEILHDRGRFVGFHAVPKKGPSV